MPENLQPPATELIVVIPVYNEAACIEEVICAWGDFLEAYPGVSSFRILVVNDGSRDRTPELLDQLSVRLPYLQVIHQANGGHGNAVLHGYRAALQQQPEWVFQVDSDNQFLATDFPRLWERKQQSDFLLGYREQRYDDANRLLISRMVRRINFLLFGVQIADSNIPYRLIRGTYLGRLLAVLPDAPFAPNIFLSVLAGRDGQELGSIPVTHKERATGQVSIIKWKLLKVCLRSTYELTAFSLSLRKRLNTLQQSKR